MRTAVSQPLLGLGGRGIQDYASLFADEATIRTMMRNANLVAESLLFAEKPRFGLFNDGAEPEQKEIDNTLKHLFLMIFQREPNQDDRDGQAADPRQ